MFVLPMREVEQAKLLIIFFDAPLLESRLYWRYGYPKKLTDPIKWHGSVSMEP